MSISTVYANIGQVDVVFMGSAEPTKDMGPGVTFIYEDQLYTIPSSEICKDSEIFYGCNKTVGEPGRLVCSARALQKLKTDGYASDRQFSDGFKSEMKRVAGLFVVKDAPEEEDIHRNTDLYSWTTPDGIRWACRVRSHSYLRLYPDDFTIRTHRESGGKTELAKILEGYGDYFIYGFASAGDVPPFALWYILDFNVLRTKFLTSLFWPGKETRNQDGTWFRSLRYRDFDPSLIVMKGP